MSVGRYCIGFNEDLYLFPTFTQNYVWTQNKAEGSPNNESITFQTTEGMSVNADVGISYHIKPSKVTTVFLKYRKGVDEITDIFLRNIVRDALNTAASKKPVIAVLISTTHLTETLKTRLVQLKFLWGLLES